MSAKARSVGQGESLARAGPLRQVRFADQDFGTVIHFCDFADSRIASSTCCVSSASRKVGEAGLPVSRPFRKSATWWVKLASYPMARPGTHHLSMYGWSGLLSVTCTDFQPRIFPSSL